MSALPYSQHPGMMPERAAGIWHEPAGDGYQWVDGPAERLPQVQAPQQPSQAPQPSVYPTQPQAGTQWVDNPTPPPVQDMVYQWVDSPSYGRPGAPAAAPVPPQQCVQAANPYYPGGDPYGALPRPMDPMALQPGIDPLRPPIQGLDPITAQYQAGLAYGAQDANRFANPQAGMAPYAPRQPLGMDDLSSIRMGGKGVPAVDAFGQAGYHDGGKRGKGSGAQRRQVDDGRKGRQAVPPGRQVDGNKGQVDAGQAALESLGTDGLRQMLISTLESLYEDRIKPMANYIKGRLKERSVPDVIVKSFEDLYTQHPDLFEVQNPKCGEETTIYFHKAPTWFKGWIDIDSSQDPYDESMWKEFAKFLDGEHTFAGGRYGMARELMQRHLPFLANYSLGEVCHIVQLAIQHRRLIVYHRKMLKPIQTVLCQLSPDGADNTEGEEIKDMDDLMLALFRMLLHHPSGIRLCRMKQMIKLKAQSSIELVAFGRARSLRPCPAMCARARHVAVLSWCVWAAVAERHEDATSWLQFSRDSQSQSTCGASDVGCQAQQLACSMATQIEVDWPVSSYQQLKDIQVQLQQVCQGAAPTEPTTVLLQTDKQQDKHEDGASRQRQDREEGSFTCPAAQQCAIDVVTYEQQNPGVKYANQGEKTVARTAVDTLKEVLKSAGIIALKGSIAFGLIGNILNNFFPSAGGLPSNPCTYATSDWGKCVWQQIMPFVQSFVAQQIDKAFESLWTKTIQGYQLRLWTLNATAYKNSAHYPNGTVQSMSNITRDRMYTDLGAVHNAMIGDINLFMTGYAINTTAGAYLARFATLHVGVMNNLLSYPTYRTAGDKYVFQTITTCYAQSVYQAATQAFKARMATFSQTLKTSYAQCGGLEPGLCALWSGDFKDTWTSCSWAFSASAISCVSGSCIPPTDPNTPIAAGTCFSQHKAWVENQTVAAWSNWLALIPWWLSNVLVMQTVPVQSNNLSSSLNFNCPAF